ncbi:MAG: polyphosphate kinase 2 family protein [Planctomyces sp.]|jgi:PPK2 family polyphosphate:nucleotide phosphotransferase|nr:polyphosphate kinase 2 family protein [Planctomyces sp.]
MPLTSEQIARFFRVAPGKSVQLAEHHTGWAQTPELESLGRETVRERAVEMLQSEQRELSERQNLLYADNRYSLLIILQGMDASGKDGTIRHVMSGVNPQGCRVTSFKHPSAEELDHTFLWRYAKCLPERGSIGIFNRSWYEEVLIVRVHRAVLADQQLPPGKRGKAFWRQRYEDIGSFEQHLVRNGTVIIKIFLNISKAEQKKRLLERLKNPEKNWKFSPGDVRERRHWDEYVEAYEDALEATSTELAPWYIVPADQKWVARSIVASIVTDTIGRLDLRYPELSETQRADFAAARQELLSEE